MKTLISALFCLLCGAAFGQKIVIKTGTLIPVESRKEIRAKDVNVGDLITFHVTEDIKVGDSVVISQGAKAYAKVLEAKKSGIAGTKGKLKIGWVYCVADNSVKIPLEDEIDFARKNHTALAVVTATVIALPLIFLTGQHAVIPKGYKNMASVRTSTEL